MFIYVFSTQDKDTLLSDGRYHLVKSDNKNHVYIFVYDGDSISSDIRKFTTIDKYALSDVLSF